MIQREHNLQNFKNQIEYVLNLQKIDQSLEQHHQNINIIYLQPGVFESDMLDDQFGGSQPQESNINSKHTNLSWSKSEEQLLYTLQKRFGNRWTTISHLIPGKTINSVKNRFYSTLRKGFKNLIRYLNQSQDKKKSKMIRKNALPKLLQFIGSCGENKQKVSNQLKSLSSQIKQGLILCYNVKFNSKQNRNYLSTLTDNIINFNNNYRKKRTTKQINRIIPRKSQKNQKRIKNQAQSNIISNLSSLSQQNQIINAASQFLPAYSPSNTLNLNIKNTVSFSEKPSIKFLDPQTRVQNYENQEEPAVNIVNLQQNQLLDKLIKEDAQQCLQLGVSCDKKGFCQVPSHSQNNLSKNHLQNQFNINELLEFSDIHKNWLDYF